MIERLINLCEAIEMRNWTEAMAIAKTAVEQTSGGAVRYFAPEERRALHGENGNAKKTATGRDVEISLYGP